MRVYVIAYTEKGTVKEFTLYASEPGKLGTFVSELMDKGCDIHDIRLANQVPVADAKHERVR